MANNYGVGMSALLLIMRAVQCNWNIFDNAIEKGITALGVITKAYFNLFKADSPEASAIQPLAPAY